MINIPLSFGAMWLIMILGVITNILAKVNRINHDSPAYIPFGHVMTRFFSKEWASYGMSLIITGIIAYSFHFMKKFEHISNGEISYWSKWIPLAVVVLFLFGVLNQAIFYWALGRISQKGKIDVDILEHNLPPKKED